MQQGKFSEEQIVKILKEADAGIKIADLCRKYGFSEATYYNRKAKYGGMGVSEIRRLKHTRRREPAIKADRRRSDAR